MKKERFLKGKFQAGDFPIKISNMEYNRIIFATGIGPIEKKSNDDRLIDLGLFTKYETGDNSIEAVELNSEIPFYKNDGTFNNNLFLIGN